MNYEEDSEKGPVTERDLLMGILKDVKYIKAEFRELKEEIRRDFDQSSENQKALEERIRTLEQWKYYTLGIVCIAGSIVGWAISWFKH